MKEYVKTSSNDKQILATHVLPQERYAGNPADTSSSQHLTLGLEDSDNSEVGPFLVYHHQNHIIFVDYSNLISPNFS